MGALPGRQRHQIVKLFLNVSSEEQRGRLLARADLPEKNCKFSAADVRGRWFWDGYQHVYADVLFHTSTAKAPWLVIWPTTSGMPRLAAGAILVPQLKRIDPDHPERGAVLSMSVIESPAMRQPDRGC